MDNPITRTEHEEFRKTVDTQIERLRDEDRRQNHRLDLLEESNKQLVSLTSSVEKLAVNMENMLKVQNQQGERLGELEGRDGEMWRKAIGYVVTTVIGIVVGCIFAQIGM